MFNKIRSLNQEVVKKIGEPVNGFSRFKLVGQSTNAVICDRCGVIDGNFGSRSKISLETYPGDLHQCISRDRKRHQVRDQLKSRISKINSYLISQRSEILSEPV